MRRVMIKMNQKLTLEELYEMAEFDIFDNLIIEDGVLYSEVTGMEED